MYILYILNIFQSKINQQQSIFNQKTKALPPTPNHQPKPPVLPKLTSMGKLKNVARVRTLGIGEVVCFSCLGVGSSTELPFKPETLNPKPKPT